MNQKSSFREDPHFVSQVLTANNLLVVRNGLPIPLPDASGRWHKKKKVASVSEDIKLAVQRQGYYLRKLTDFKKR